MISIVASSLVIVPIGCNITYINDPENHELITSIKCFSVSSYYLPPMITFKGSYYLRKYFKNQTDDNIF